MIRRRIQNGDDTAQEMTQQICEPVVDEIFVMASYIFPVAVAQESTQTEGSGIPSHRFIFYRLWFKSVQIDALHKTKTIRNGMKSGVTHPEQRLI